MWCQEPWGINMEVIKNDICIMSILYQSGAGLSAITSGAVGNMLLVKTLLLLTKKKKRKKREEEEERHV